jgi:hypothetical protein
MRAKSPSVKRSTGPGIPPFIVIPLTSTPVMFVFWLSIMRSYSIISAWAMEALKQSRIIKATRDMIRWVTFFWII